MNMTYAEERINDLLTTSSWSLQILQTTMLPSPKSPNGNNGVKNFMYGIFILNGIFVIVGLLGNICVCVVIVRGRRMYTIANLFLMNLAIADIFVLVISYPLWAVKTFKPHSWPFGSAMCRILVTVSDAFYGVSLGCMTAIAIHRYRMIIYSMDKQLTFVQAKLIVIFIWVMSLGTISAPLYPAISYANGTCTTQWPSHSYERTYQLFLVVAWYILPLFVILLTYLRIKFYLQSQMKYEWLTRGQHSEFIRDRIVKIGRALRMLAPVVLIFAFFMLPWNILRVVSALLDIRKIKIIVFYAVTISATMLIANSIVNPFIYYIMSDEFKEEFFKQIWLLKSKFKNNEESETYTIETTNHGRRFVRRLSSFQINGEGSLAGSPKKPRRGTATNNNNYDENDDDNKRCTQIDFDELFRNASCHKNGPYRPSNHLSSITEEDFPEKNLIDDDVFVDSELQETIL